MMLGFMKKSTDRYLPLLHLHNPVQSRVFLWSGKNSGAPQGKDVSHSSGVHCVLPLCGFAIKSQEGQKCKYAG